MLLRHKIELLDCCLLNRLKVFGRRVTKKGYEFDGNLPGSLLGIEIGFYVHIDKYWQILQYVYRQKSENDF